MKRFDVLPDWTMQERDSSECDLRYVLITPARNEDAFIERTMRAVIEQTMRPSRWIIVSDGSVDRTDEIVNKFAAKHDWIELVHLPDRKKRDFAGKVHAFNAGLARLGNFQYSIIGNLDADITFEEDYMEFLLQQFAQNSQLGVAGTPFREASHQYDYRFSSIEHVSGACQLFRRECFESIGGYVPLREGGVDLAAVVAARMKGWQTRTFLEKSCEHNKKTQTRSHATLVATFKSGYHDYLMGSDPAWQMLRSVYQMSKRPYLIGGSTLLMGFVWAALKRSNRIVPKEMVAYRQKEQQHRIGQLLARVFPRRRGGSAS
jgi:poly-beta-1,6-N-acetyl-D-glucosamine synthase